MTDVELINLRWGAHLDMLEALVDMRMLEMASISHDTLVAHSRNLVCGVYHPNQGVCRGVATVIASHADAWMYTPTRPEGRAARRALVDGLAVAALVAEGGITLAGRHWCGGAHQGCVRVQGGAL